LLEIGEGRVPTISEEESDTIILPEDIVLSSQDLNDLINFVYPDLSMHSDPKYFVERGILTPTNEYVNSINTIIMNQFPGEAVEYLSADTVEEADRWSVATRIFQPFNLLVTFHFITTEVNIEIGMQSSA
jgi:hypothetical protein